MRAGGKTNLENIAKLQGVEFISELHTELEVVGGTNNGVDENHGGDLITRGEISGNVAREKKKKKKKKRRKYQKVKNFLILGIEAVGADIIDNRPKFGVLLLVLAEMVQGLKDLEVAVRAVNVAHDDQHLKHYGLVLQTGRIQTQDYGGQGVLVHHNSFDTVLTGIGIVSPGEGQERVGACKPCCS